MLIDTDEEENDKSSPKKDKSMHKTLLVDTDDECPKERSSTSNNSSMSKRNKLDYRVAKKRKAKAKKEMEMADIIQSKNWDASSSAFFSASSHRQARNTNMGNISDSLLNNIEQKYGCSKNKKKYKKGH